MADDTLVFDAKLVRGNGVPYAGVSRKLAIRSNQQLAGLHNLIQEAFDWEDDHLYAFWLDGKFWSRDAPSYQPPFELEEMQAQSAHIRLDRLGLEPGQKMAYLFDFGDEWRVLLTYRGVLPEGGPARVLESRGAAPPQYPDYDEDEED